MSIEELARETISTRLKEAREAAGYPSAISFCKESEVSLTLYLAQEAGKRRLKFSHAMYYSKCFRVSLEWLLLGI